VTTSTTDEIRNQLLLDLKSSAEWRRQKAEEFPQDKRNAAAAELLDRVAKTVVLVDPATLDAYGALFDDFSDAESHSELMREIGFTWWPETATDIVRRFIANRTTGEA